MKKLNIILFCFVLCALHISVIAQTSVVPFDANKDYLNGIVYSLPKTQIDVTITARHTIEKPGPFYQYAERYLATKEAITINNEHWEVENIKISTTAIVDASRTFQVAIDNKGMANNIVFYKGNIIGGVNILSDNRPLTPAGSSPNLGEQFKDNSQLSILNSQLSTLNSRLSTLNSQLSFDYSALNEETLMATSIPKMAEMVARQIYHIRESRTALLTADLDQLPDGEALKTMLARLDSQEKELVAFFTGKSVSYTVTKTYSITPDDDLNSHVIARISSAEGLIDADNVIGEPIYLTVEGTYYNAPLTDPKQEKQPKGFYYNVPGSAVVTIECPDSDKHIVTLPIAQFGYTTYLNAAITNSKSAWIVFNPELGTIESIGR